MSRTPPPAALKGILFALGGALMLSVNDVAIKFLSSDYALHQVILIAGLHRPRRSCSG